MNARKVLTAIITVLISVAVGSALVIAALSVSVKDHKSETVAQTATEIVGTYEIHDIHDESIPANIKTITVYLNDSPEGYPYWFGPIDMDACEAGRTWYSEAYSQSDEKTKKFQCYPETGKIGFYMKNGDSYIFVDATSKEGSRKIQVS